MYDASQELDEGKNFRKVMSLWPTGIALVTAFDRSGVPIGIICNSLTSLSVKKRQLLWAVDNEVKNYSKWKAVNNWAVHFLAYNQKRIVKEFLRKNEENKFQNIDFKISDLNTPWIEGFVSRIECVTESLIETEDHTVIIGKAVRSELSKKTPMLYFNKSFRKGFKQ